MAFRVTMYILLAASLLANAFLIYRVLDMAVTISHSSDEARYRAKQLRAMRSLLPALVKEKTGGDLRNAAKASGLEVDEEEENDVRIENIRFRLTDGRIESVDFDLSIDEAGQ